MPTFGDRGAIDLRAGVRAENYPERPYMMASPGLVYRNLIVTGAQGQEDNSEGPAMDVRAWDVRTGRLVWTFHTIPHPGEPGYETWPKDYWMTASTPANWGFGSVGTERGLIFLPIGQPAAQYCGGHRPQENLYGSSVVALDALFRTSRRSCRAPWRRPRPARRSSSRVTTTQWLAWDQPALVTSTVGDPSARAASTLGLPD